MARFRLFAAHMQSESEHLIQEVNELALLIQSEAAEKDSNVTETCCNRKTGKHRNRTRDTEEKKEQMRDANTETKM